MGRSRRWEIEYRGGTYDLRRGGRAVAYDLDDPEEAIRKILRSSDWHPGDEVWLVEEDGYRRRVRDRQLRD